MRAAAVALLLAAGLGGAGCGLLDRGGGTVDPDTPLAEQCGDVPDGAQRVVLTAADGRSLGAAVVGDAAAPVGLVLVHGLTQTLCDWLPEAARIAREADARVLLEDRRGRGSSPGREDASHWPGDVVTGARWLRDAGAGRVAVLGSSLGGPIALAAASPSGPRTAVDPPQPEAPVLDPPPCAAIAVSPITASSGDGGSVRVAAIEDFASPLWIAYEAGSGGMASGVEGIAAGLRAAGAPAQHLHPEPGSDHSIGLVEGHPDVQRFLVEAVRSCAG